MRRTKKRYTRERKEMEVDITSLLDILVILLVFLLKSYNPSDLKLDVVKDLSLAKSHAKDLGNKTVIIQVDKKNNIFINNKETTNLVKKSAWRSELTSELKKISDKNKREIAQIKTNDFSSMRKELIKKKEETMERVNIVLHEDLPYETLDKVMQVAANSGFHKFSFIVQSKLN